MLAKILSLLRWGVPFISIRKTVSDSKILPAAENYAAEDVMSESASVGTAFIFQGMARRPGGTGVIEKAQVMLSKTGLTPRITLYLFTENPTTNLYDNIANTAPSTDDFPNCEGQIDFMALSDLGGGSMALATPNTVGNIPLPYRCNSTRLYGLAVLQDAESDEEALMTLSFKLQIKQD